MTDHGYAAAATTVHWLLADLDTALARLPQGAALDNTFIRDACATRVPTPDEVSVAVNGLLDLGVLRPTGHGYAFDAPTFLSTRDYRRGFADGFAALRGSEPSAFALCMAIPPELPSRFKQGIADAAADLRASIVNVVAAATHRLVLASPFWDVATASDIGELARRRVDAGVKLDILGRSDATNDAMSHLNRLFAGHKGVRVFRWYDPAGARDVTTFHFKAVVADDGARAYVGTANLTRGGLRSTMELGFIVGDAPGRAVARIVDAVIGISERVGP
ncbi:MAG TPA: phospholipase D-like domain-containing protein [Vicinamibacterales bacterium]|nr:phospholipase D-like domain-containing protein [Vicinamibacterales bacterium]